MKCLSCLFNRAPVLQCITVVSQPTGIKSKYNSKLYYILSKYLQQQLVRQKAKVQKVNLLCSRARASDVGRIQYPSHV
jgi:hypothetical protein